jgi:triosephosphate isomerase
MRRPLVVANWKMHKTVRETVLYASELLALSSDLVGVDLLIAPPFTALAAAATATRGSRIGVAAQDVSCEREGAFTGDVSAPMVHEAGASHAIVGHSERRRGHGETDLVVQRKLQAARTAGLVPIVCVGETLDERDGGHTFDVIDRQLAVALDGLTGDTVAALVVAYEPVWAIGTGRVATTSEAEQVHAHLRGRLRQWCGGHAAASCRVLYGGSVRADNIIDIMKLPDVDGALVGGASLEVGGFVAIARGAQR